MQGTNRQVHCQLQEAVSCSVQSAELEGQPASDMAGGNASWEPRTLLSQSPAALSQAHRLPLAGKALATPSLAGPWLSFLCLALALLPAQLFAAECTLGNDIHLTCFPESRMAKQANSASTMVCPMEASFLLSRFALQVPTLSAPRRSLWAWAREAATELLPLSTRPPPWGTDSPAQAGRAFGLAWLVGKRSALALCFASCV